MKILTGICFFVGVALFGQDVAQISGTVTDQSGSVVPDVQVTATQTETGVKRSAVTDNSGFYVFPNLPLGPYRVEALKMGFRAFVQTGLVLQVGTNPIISVTLTVGSVSDQVMVEANAAQVETRSAGVGTVVETQRILVGSPGTELEFAL